jgi:hypothetical protein
MSEERFANRVVENLEAIKKNEIKFVKDPALAQSLARKDGTDLGELRGNLVSDNSSSYIVDSVIIKGVSPRRKENDSNFDYSLMKNLDNQGLRFYNHKYFSGHMHYYQHLGYQKQLERI